MDNIDMTNNDIDMTKNSQNKEKKQWIRGVNLGGWLVMERYIVPYQFAITDCHLAGDYCWYPGALSAPPVDDNVDNDTHYYYYKECNLNRCSPHRINVLNHTGFDYPVDEWTLAEAFRDSGHDNAGEEWFNFHFDHFITKDDIQKVYDFGITHLRVPLPHWILGDTSEDEPYIVGKRWQAFGRLVQWVREINTSSSGHQQKRKQKQKLEIWPNLHTAPGSQNGFDNSGREAPVFTCFGWDKFPSRVQKTLDIINHITSTLAQEEMLDVVTGFGLLNEPFGDCNDTIYHDFIERGYDIARRNLGSDVNVFVSDKFYAPLFNDGQWWLNDKKYKNTYLDSHFYHVFDDHARALDPVQHIQMTCEPNDLQLSITSCCYQDAPSSLQEQQNEHYSGTIVSNNEDDGAVKRIATEWSVAFDAHPGELLKVIMDGIAYNGIAPNFHRTIEAERKDFLVQFGQAQMVAYEAAQVQGLSDGWFYWTLKMEGGSFAEWDFIRGMEQGFLPRIVAADTASANVYGTCNDITARVMNKNYNFTDIVHPFPWMDEPYWRDNVPWTIPARMPPNTTHSDWYNVSNSSSSSSSSPLAPLPPPTVAGGQEQHFWVVHIGAIVLTMYLIRSLYHCMKHFCSSNNNNNINRSQYTPILQEVTAYHSSRPANDHHQQQRPLKHVCTVDTFDCSSSDDGGGSSSDGGVDDDHDGCQGYNNNDNSSQFARTMNHV